MKAHKAVVEIEVEGSNSAVEVGVEDSPNSVVEVGVEAKNSWAGVEVEEDVDLKDEAFFPEKIVI